MQWKKILMFLLKMTDQDLSQQVLIQVNGINHQLLGITVSESTGGLVLVMKEDKP